jgi:anti-sigma factor RsiW
MTPIPSHAELAELLGAYALDAVDEPERSMIEAHLRECPRCRAEVEEHREVAAHLAFAGAGAPEGVWSGIAAALDPDDPSADLARLYPLRRTRRPAAFRGLLAAAAVVALICGVVGYQLHSRSGQVSLQKVMAAASHNPASTRMTLASADNKIHLDVVLAGNGTGYLASNGTLAPLPDSETYQLWGSAKTGAISLGVIGGHPDVVAFSAPTGAYSALAITAERAGGVAQPTSEPIAAGSIPHPA